MKSMIETSRRICIAVTVVMAARISAQSWTAPVVLSTGGQGWEAAAAIDGDGNSLAVWDERTTQDQLWSRSRAHGANWGSVTQVSPALQTTSVFPAVRITTAGFATAVWTDSNGVWTADRPAASAWGSPQLLISQARIDHTSTLLLNGMVLVAGGLDRSLSAGFTILSSAELYTP
jgi:hypothetical protein